MCQNQTTVKNSYYFWLKSAVYLRECNIDVYIVLEDQKFVAHVNWELMEVHTRLVNDDINFTLNYSELN